MRPGWFEVWLRNFGRGREFDAVTVRRGGRLAAVLPLLRGRSGHRSATNWHTHAYGPVAADADAAREVAAVAIGRSRAWLDCSFLDPADPFTAAMQAEAIDAGRRVIARPVLRSPYIRLEGDFEEFCASLPSKFLREIRRRRRRLESERGDVAVIFTDGRDDLARQLDEGFAVEGSGWKSELGTSIAQNPSAERFYRDLAAWAAPHGLLQLGFVRVAGRAAAFSFAIVLGDTVYVMKVGFDPYYARYGVGTLLTCHAVQRAFGQGRRVYDFLGAEDRYKLDWTPDVHERLRVQAFARSPTGRAGYLAWRYGRPPARRVRDWTGGGLPVLSFGRARR
jgi:CelD/BcsL family acetyltransferase involved in cellulose biosynthesis